MPHLPAAVGLAAMVLVVAPAGLREASQPGAQPAAQPAVQADVRLHQSDVVATEFGVSDCSDFAPDQPAAGQEGWVFQAPFDGGRLRMVRLRFATPDGDVEVALDVADSGVSPWGSRIFDNGTEAWLTMPAGWTLLDGAATVTRSTTSDFNLIRTCRRPQSALPDQVDARELARAEAAPAETHNSAESITVVVGSPTPTPTPTGTAQPTSPPGAGQPPAGQPPAGQPPAGRPPVTSGRLPVTGAPIGWLIVAALALIGIGVALRTVRRRALPISGD